MRRCFHGLSQQKCVNDSKVLYVKTSFLDASLIDTDKKMMINLDGEYGGDAPMRFENLHQHIEFYANTDEINDDAILGQDDQKREAGIELVKEYEKIQDEDSED